MGDAYDYSILGDDLDPDDLHEEMVRYGSEIAEALQSAPQSSETLVDDFLLDTLSKMIFGSNYIEQAGSGPDITLKLCRQVFRGDDLPDTIEERDPDYARLKAELLSQGIAPSVQVVLRTRREIIQHAKAASYIMTHVYLYEKDLTEDLILETHRRLTHGIDTDQGYSWTQYSGVYRQVPVVAGFISFPDEAEVPSLMRRMIHNLNEDLRAAVKAGSIDPVALAAKYCHTFVNIHPFVDGNGRTCRLILNALLLKYGSFVACIGQEDETRKKYLEIAANASMNELSSRGEFDNEERGAPKHYKDLASFILKHTTDGLKKLVQILRGTQERSTMHDESGLED
ncbi:Fic-domain-containing protein [Coniochaeta hoffmannii]|uniref:Fic-domain-containing protein n=1 Tax=Coniochaeta hoffmannii TaxID=91930 RepID=A0AA38VTT8_9PEZI|nr:Fic-domain-containing protein [Coniochaeta hoffmannii]